MEGISVLENLNMINLLEIRYILLSVMVAAFFMLLTRYVLGISIMNFTTVTFMNMFIGFFMPNYWIISIALGSITLVLSFMLIHYVFLFLKNYIYHYGAKLIVVSFIPILLLVLILDLYRYVFPSVIVWTVLPETYSPLLALSALLLGLSDMWLKAQIQFGYKKTWRLFKNSILVSILGGGIIASGILNWALVRSMYFYAVVLVLFVLLILIGRYKGLRLMEYIRFKRIKK